MKFLRVTGVALFALALLVALSAPASAVTYNFTNITCNNVECAQLGSQLQMDVLSAGVVGGVSYVDFKFTNNIGIASSITDIYFDDGTLLGISNITSSAGVVFAQGANPGNLPSGNNANPAFQTTAGFSADSSPPAAPNGVNTASEWVTITFALINGKTYADTLAALADGTLRVGLHVQAIGVAGGSDSFIHVPEPGFYGLLSMGLAGLGFFAMRRRRSVGPQAE